MPSDPSGGGIPTATVHAHRGIEEAIDRAYLTAILASARARTYLSFPRGPYREVFLDFYEPVIALFELTSQMEALSLGEGLRNDMKSWINAGNGGRLNKAKTIWLLKVGLNMFSDYNNALTTKGVVSVHRR